MIKQAIKVAAMVAALSLTVAAAEVILPLFGTKNLNGAFVFRSSPDFVTLKNG